MSQLIRLWRGHNTLFAAACEQSHPCQCLDDPGADAVLYSATKGRLAHAKRSFPHPISPCPKCHIELESTFLAIGNPPRRPYSGPKMHGKKAALRTTGREWKRIRRPTFCMHRRDRPRLTFMWWPFRRQFVCRLRAWPERWNRWAHLAFSRCASRHLWPEKWKKSVESNRQCRA